MYGPSIYNDVVPLVHIKLFAKNKFAIFSKKLAVKIIAFQISKDFQMVVTLKWRVYRTINFVKYKKFENTCRVFFHKIFTKVMLNLKIEKKNKKYKKNKKKQNSVFKRSFIVNQNFV